MNNMPVSHRKCEKALDVVTAHCDIVAMTQTLKNRHTDLVESGRMTRAGLARAAGLHANTLRNLGAADWNPSAETLDKLEAYLASDGGSVMATAEEIINEALNGRMFILSTMRTGRMRAIW